MFGIRRREFVALFGGAAAYFAARAQQAMPVIGFLDPRSLETTTDRLRAFRQGLKDAGYVEGENVAVEYRWGDGQFDRQRANLPRIGFLGLVPETFAEDGLRAGLRGLGYIEGSNIVIEWRWAQNVGELPALAAELARNRPGLFDFDPRTPPRWAIVSHALLLTRRPDAPAASPAQGRGGRLPAQVRCAGTQAAAARGRSAARIVGHGPLIRKRKSTSCIDARPAEHLSQSSMVRALPLLSRSPRQKGRHRRQEIVPAFIAASSRSPHSELQ